MNFKKIFLQNKKNVTLVENKSANLTFYHKWKINDIIMLDNKRFLHGRNSFSKKEKRKIINIQTLKANFPYENLN